MSTFFYFKHVFQASINGKKQSKIKKIYLPKYLYNIIIHCVQIGFKPHRWCNANDKANLIIISLKILAKLLILELNYILVHVSLSLTIYFILDCFFRLIIDKNSSDCANTFLYETDLRIEDMGTFSYFHKDIIFVYIFTII